MSALDVQAVRLEIKEAAHRAFAQIRSEHPEERFYVFALCADIDVQGVCPSSNTEEDYRRCLARYEPRRARIEASLANSGMTYADHSNLYRWNPPEWAYHGLGIKEFLTLDPLIEHDDDLEDDDPAAFLALQVQFYSCMVLALKDLDGEGFFGEGDRRAAVTLFCDIVEPTEKAWFNLESARLLNPPSAFDAFSPQWLAFLSRAEREIILDPERHSPTYRPLQAFLAGELAR